mmetsp:Transcript_22599/g.25471  ORF Transcript_22599/g.25471 Transcript_22599/m.25471 type:complete len:507 (-) Transcript_22599:424-1944(-)
MSNYVFPIVATVGLLVLYKIYQWATSKSAKKSQKAQPGDTDSEANAAYMISKLHPDSTHMDVLLVVATTPDSILHAQQAVDKADKLRQEKLQKLKEAPATEEKPNDAFDLDDGGWDEGDDADEETKAAAQKEKEALEEKAKARAEVAKMKASVSDILMEGIDDGVLGQKWVENAIEEQGFWPPPDMGVLKGSKFVNAQGKQVDPMEHPAIRRNLCMTMGRLNAQMLNVHPELLEAGAKQLIDQTYFRSTMEYRQRVTILLDVALRVAVTTKSYRLAQTIIEAVSMFKIGAMSASDEKTIQWFEDAMRKQYAGEAGVPKLEVKNYKVFTPDEEEIATDDECVVELEMERLHAENFTKQKVAVCQKQGIPPQVALQTYREGWWMLVRAKRLDGDDAESSITLDANNPLTKLFGKDGMEKYKNEKGDNRLVSAWPMLVKNVAQKTGKVQVQFQAPAVPGKYRFSVAIKSQEFLGADQEFSVEAEVLDKATVKREKKTEANGDDEAKKDQ